jgi:carbamoyl-phosphate synthase large subunit
MNILVLSAGGPACHGVIKSLRDIEFNGKIVSVDYNPLSAGFYLSDSYYVVPKASDDTYIDELLKVVEKENIDIILPTSSSEIVTITKNSDRFGGVNLFMSDYESIMICSDKLKFYEKCKDKFPLPTTDTGYSGEDLPLFAKPRIHSAGSRGVKVLQELSDINCLEHEKYDYIYQEYLPGIEYTIDVLCDMKSNPLVAVPRKRLQTKEGISTKAEIVKNDFIEKICFDICKFLKLKGSICLQMKEDQSGELKFVEINPRFGGGTYFASLAGVNFMKVILDLINENPIEIKEPNLIKIMRYYKEVIV